MKLSSLLVAAVAIAVGTSAAHATIIDDFSGSTLSSAYTQTAVLDNNSAREVNFSVNTTNGTLQSTYTAVTGQTVQPEQVVLLRSDFTLPVGSRLSADVNPAITGSQDLGILVAATATPTITSFTNGPQRADYLLAGVRSTAGHFVAGGFDGTTALTTDQDQTDNSTAITGLFIDHTAAGFDVGFVRGGTDHIVGTYTFQGANAANIGNAIGFYTDMRAAGTLDGLDNLRVEAVPEPASLGLLSIGAMGLLARRRRR